MSVAVVVQGSRQRCACGQNLGELRTAHHLLGPSVKEHTFFYQVQFANDLAHPDSSVCPPFKTISSLTEVPTFRPPGKQQK